MLIFFVDSISCRHVNIEIAPSGLSLKFSSPGAGQYPKRSKPRERFDVLISLFLIGKSQFTFAFSQTLCHLIVVGKFHHLPFFLKISIELNLSKSNHLSVCHDLSF